MENPARSDKDDIDVILLLGKPMHFERNHAHRPRKEVVDAGANEDKNEQANSTSRTRIGTGTSSRSPTPGLRKKVLSSLLP